MVSGVRRAANEVPADLIAAQLEPGLTIAQLSHQTGVPPGTLRMWEARHGFPQPKRLPSGHRRYSVHDARLIQAVVRLRNEGLSLPAAITKAQRERGEQLSTIFAGLRERRPDLQPMFLPKATLLRLSHAIEDDFCAHGACSGVLVGSFQRERFYRQSGRRWRELARGAQTAVAIADFPVSRHRPGAPHEVPIARDHPLSREWSLIVRAPGACACLAAWELPLARRVPDDQRRFEVIWSPEPEIVDLAIAIAARLISASAAAVAAQLSAGLQQAAAPSIPELRAVASIAHRMIAYVATDSGPSRGTGLSLETLRSGKGSR